MADSFEAGPAPSASAARSRSAVGSSIRPAARQRSIRSRTRWSDIARLPLVSPRCGAYTPLSGVLRPRAPVPSEALEQLAVRGRRRLTVARSRLLAGRVGAVARGVAGRGRAVHRRAVAVPGLEDLQ